MVTPRRKRFVSQAENKFSNQGSRDRLRERRGDAQQGIGQKDERHQSDDQNRQRLQGAAASQPELRLRAPIRKTSLSQVSSADRSKTAERERAAGRPGTTSRDAFSRADSQKGRRSPHGVGSISGRNLHATAPSHQAKDRHRHKDRDRERFGTDSFRRVNTLEESQQEGSGTGRKTKEERETERKLAQRRGKQRQRLIKAGAIALAGLCLTGFAAWGVLTFINSSVFHVNSVKIEGARLLSAQDIEDIAQVDFDTSTITMDTGSIEERLMESPWIAQASVSTNASSDVIIEVQERVPAIMLEVDSDYWVVSSEGHWLGYLRGGESPIVDPMGRLDPVQVEDINIIPVEGVIDLDPQWGDLVSDESVNNVLAHLRGLDSRIVSRVSRIVAPEVGRTSLFTSDEVELDVGRADRLEDKSGIILAILEEHGDNVVLINVRSVENPSWRGLNR